jgi:hypothetical protein
LRVMPGATSRAPSASQDGSVQPTAPGLARARSLAARVWSDHRLFILVLAPAVLLRVDAELGYRWQSWFNDSFEYLANTISFSLDPTRVSGYSIWLRILEPFHSYALITILQHLEGLSVGVMVYALARHRFGAKAWIAALAAVPVLYDGFEIQLEHLILSDVPFLFLIMLAATLLLWHPAGPSTRMCAVIGLLLGLAAVLRSIGLPLVAVFAVYMIIRRVNWRKVAAAIVVCAIPVFAYAGVFYLEHGQFAMSDATGVFLYSRVMSFANCSVIHPPADELELCPPTGHPDSLGIAQNYIWTPPTPLDYFPSPKFTPVPNSLGEDFAIRAIEAQPFGYVKAVVHDTVMAFGWKRIVFPQAATYDEYLFGTKSLPIPNWDRVDLGTYHTYASFYVRGNPLTQVVNPFATIIRVYQEYVWLPGTVYCLILLAGLGGIVLAWRRLGGEALLPWGISFAMILVPAATAEFDYRYVLPAVPFACLAAVMAFSRGTAGRDALEQLTGLGRAKGTADVSRVADVPRVADVSRVAVADAPPASAVDSGDDDRDLAADGA